MYVPKWYYTCLANEFAKKFNTRRVVASDYNVQPHVKYDKSGESYFSLKSAQKNPKGFKVYYKGVGNPPSIGVEFKGIEKLLDKARKYN